MDCERPEQKWGKAGEEDGVIEIKDADGNSLPQILYEGVYFPAFPGIKPRLQRLQALKARADDIMILAYPKSGTHWTWEIVNMLYKRKAETIRGEKIEQFLELVDQEVLDIQPNPRILNTHVRPSLYPPDFIQRRTKIIYLLRNPKDALVSFYHHTVNIGGVYHYENGKWPAYFDLAMEGKMETGSWFDYVLLWEKFFNEHSDIPVLTLFYEDMKQNLSEEVKKISWFLGLDVDNALCGDIAEACTFESMKTEKMRLYPEAARKHWNNNEYKMYRNGKAGDWKNWFTVAQNARFDAEFTKRMKDSKIVYGWT